MSLEEFITLVMPVSIKIYAVKFEKKYFGTSVSIKDCLGKEYLSNLLI